MKPQNSRSYSLPQRPVSSLEDEYVYLPCLLPLHHNANVASLLPSVNLFKMAILRVLATTAIFPALLLASKCSDQDHTKPKAIDSIPMQPVGDSLKVWNISTAVTETQDADNKHHKLQQKFWMGSEAPSNTSAADLPFTGCIFLLQPNVTSKYHPLQQSADDNGCAKYLDSTCQWSMIDIVSTNLKAQVGSNGAWACTMLGQMLAQPTRECLLRRPNYSHNVVSLRKLLHFDVGLQHR